MSDNPYEKQHRFKKAYMLADILEQSDLSMLQIEKLSAQEKDIVATLARVNTPSEETWNIAIQLLQKRVLDPLAH
jgi:hypothetical protein